MNGIISSMNPYIVLSCLRYLFPSKRLNLFKKGRNKKKTTRNRDRRTKKQNEFPFRFVPFRKKKEKKGEELKNKDRLKT